MHLREPQVATTSGKPLRVHCWPLPTRGHTGGDPCLPRTGLPGSGAEHWLTAAQAQDCPGCGAGACGSGSIPAGISPGRPGPSSHPTLSQLFRLAETLRFCSSRAARMSYARLAGPHIVPEPRSATRNGSFSIVQKAPERFLLLPNNTKPPHHTLSPSPPAIHRHTHTQLGCPYGLCPAVGALGAKPLPQIRLCAQVPTTSGQFSGRLI